jgi:4-diphosphocytidyl-2-C-methyl-D-erythritol kinase
VRLTKSIPAAAGLGGGSADAAAAIVAGLTLWAGWDRALAERLAASLGSDIPLFLGDHQRGCGLAHATGRGEQVEILASQPELNFVITHPPAGASTAAVYQRWQSTGSPQSSQAMLEACRQLAEQPNSNAVERALFNALQRPTSQLTPWIEQQLAAFAKLGKLSALMSGSGTACYALTSEPEESRYLTEKLIELGLPRVYAAQAWYAAPIETQLDRIAEDLATC